MNRRLSLLAAALAGATTLAAASAASAATACADLANLALPDTKITTAEVVKAGSFNAPGLREPVKVPEMCRVAGVVAPAIKFEVWLPEGRGYNGKFQAVGGGGFAGVISYGAMAQAVNAGYASASTDTGHEASDSAWLSDRQRVIDYGYRAIHEMTLKAKALIDAHYGGAPTYSYFNGCSTGGRQGLMEAQRYPDDYNGIVSGAPVFTFTHLHVGQLWTARATLLHPESVLTPADFALVTKAAVAQCDAADGVKDGLLTDPSTCPFQPSSLACKAGEKENCLTDDKIHAFDLIYEGARNPRTGVPIYPGLEPGGETGQPGNPGWAMLMNGKAPFALDTGVIGGMLFENPNWDWKTFDFDRDLELLDNKLAGILNAVDPDLRDFKSHGGKLIIYHGWSDPGVMPQRTIDYYNEMIAYARKSMGVDGAAYTSEYARLFMMPGMGHCRGGNGPDQADFMSAVAGWVENGQAPEMITARSERNGKVVMTRPLCPHPELAQYKGKGDTNDARNFECAAPKK